MTHRTIRPRVLPAFAVVALLLGVEIARGQCLDPNGFSLSWTKYVAVDDQNGANAAVVDVLGNVIVVGYGELPGGQSEILTAKFDVTANGGSPDPVWFREYPHPSGDDARGLKVAVDLDANIVVAGYVDAASGLQVPIVLRYTAEGTVLWTRSFEELDLLADPEFYAIQIDSEGAVYVAGNDQTPSGQLLWFVARLNALNGDVLWLTRFVPGETPPPSAEPADISQYEMGLFGSLALDRRDNVLVTGSMQVDGQEDAITMRLDPTTGQPAWIKALNLGLDERPQAIGVDHDGRVFISGTAFHPDTAAQYFTKQYDPANQFFGWLGTFADGVYLHNQAIDRQGNVYVVGNGGTVKWPATGPPAAWINPEASGYDLAVDRLGNPYITTSPFGAGVTTKLNRDTGECVWQASLPDTRLFDVVVDYSRGVYVVGGSGAPPGYDTTFLAVRYQQDFLSVPEVFTDTPDFQVENESLWAPDIPSFEYDFELYSDSWNVSESYGDSFGVPLVGDFGGELSLDLALQPYLGFRAAASLGSFDATYPGTAQITINGLDKYYAGDPLPIDTSWTPDPCARLTGKGAPEFNAGIVVSNAGAATFEISLEAPGHDLDWTLFDQALDVPETYILSVQDLFAGSPPQPGVWVPISDSDILTGQARLPRMLADGGLVGNDLVANIDEKFLTMRFNATNAITTQLGVPTVISESSNVSVFEFKVEAALMQLFAQGDWSILQDLEIAMTPFVRLEFSDGLGTRTLDLGESLDPNDPNAIVIPADGTVTITPTVGLSARFENVTSIRPEPTIGWETAKATASASALGWTLAKVSECIGCIDFPFPVDPIELYHNDWSLEFAEHQLAPISIQVDPNTAPRIVAASRESLPMIIYDQINPNQSFFNGDVNKTSKMLLYGVRLRNSNLSVTICHHGRDETVPTTWLDDSTLLVEIPNRFRLLPGTARIFVQNQDPFGPGLLTSNSLDLPIEYPLPNLATVNPNLWAADPELATVPVSVIDGMTPAGNNTFIARRDYFIKMRDDLWNASTANGIDAETYFPTFDFDAPPGFPAVMFAGRPMPRFVQPIDNGIHNIRLPESAYSSPGLVDVFLANPVPGGGMSQVRQLDIAAPRPVISGLEPAIVRPGSEDFTLIVKGPPNVPYWQGYEEPKFGNFTAASVVYWDDPGDPNNALPTTFVNSSELHADIPASRVAEYGYHEIRVFTPDNGSVYFEQLVDGTGDIVYQGLIPSGCTVLDNDGTLECGSVPMVFPVSYPDPHIDAISPSSAEACSVAFTAPRCNDLQQQHYDPAGTTNCWCFVENEQAGVVFEASPEEYPLEILRVGIEWRSLNGGAPPSTEQAIHLYAGGLPDPGSPVFTLDEPVLIDGTFNEFDIEQQPGEITIDSGPFTVALEFANANLGQFTMPTVTSDGAGCQPGKNVVYAIPGGWTDACSLGVSGDWKFYVVYRSCRTDTPNLVVTGSDFAPGAVVYWNGSPRATNYLSETQLEATLLAADVNDPGIGTVFVANPLASGGQSNPVEFTLEFVDCNSNGVSDQCDIADGTSNDDNNNQIPDECEGGPGPSLIGGAVSDPNPARSAEAEPR